MVERTTLNAMLREELERAKRQGWSLDLFQHLSLLIILHPTMGASITQGTEVVRFTFQSTTSMPL